MGEPNLDYIRKIANGDQEFFNKLIKIVKFELPNEVDSYNDYMQRGCFMQAANIVHKIKHKAIILSWEDAYQIAATHEENLKAGSNVDQASFDNYLTAMLRYISTI
ncbi:Hpt domain-containing protein [Aestuariibaculum sediminum]|uniref:Hpt domain-containing protein n=1 Tax=Aestuariibaculum sediminum TaxID=2770637 RepID=A0A8J6Q2X1_9FLAO|nr:Hpt domain-containing protein [Aestuariibaculum sediminum]MBD0832736.1 Hpt domain-containing protein [Aestuariibaculum sediminum]